MQRSALLAVLALLALSRPAQAMTLKRSGTLGPNQARVEGKFCYDASSDPNRKPGLFSFKLQADITAADQLYLFLFDDQWQSFPQAAAVWNEASCEEKVKTARWSALIQPEWVQQPGGFAMDVNVTEKMRPRFWYVALVSCTPRPISFSYEFRLTNPLRGFESEFGYDELGTLSAVLMFAAIYAVLGYNYLREFASPSANAALPEGGKLLLWFLGVSIWLAAGAALMSALHLFAFALDGSGIWFVRDASKLCMLGAKCLLMLLLALLARGELFAADATSILMGAGVAAKAAGALASPARGGGGAGGLAEMDHGDSEAATFAPFTPAPRSAAGGRTAPLKAAGMPVTSGLVGELLGSFFETASRLAEMGEYQKLFLGTAAFGLLAFVLELWGTYSYASNFSPTYVYDTLAGMGVITLDLLYLGYYANSLLRTFNREGAPKRRQFYQQWGLALGCWFLALPATALFAYVVSPWHRFRVVNFVVHSLNCAAFYALTFALSPLRLARFAAVSHRAAPVGGEYETI